MPLSGALQADFSDFVAESQKASAALGMMDAEAKKTGTTLAKTGQVMDGFGQKKTVSTLGDLSQGLRTVDSSLTALGYNVAKPIAAIEELGRVSSASIASLGALGQAGLVLSAAMAGWELGKWIRDISGMDAAAKNLQENFLGWNNRAQEAAIGQEVLALASQRTGRTITDMTEAIRENYNWVKNHATEVGTATHRQAGWEREIRAHRAELPEMTAALANHTATVKQLHEQYNGISINALTYYVAKTKDQAAAQREAAAEAKKLTDVQAQLFGTGAITKANEYQLALGGIGNLSRMTAEEQAKLNTTVGDAIEVYKRMGQTAPQALRDLYIATIQIPPVVTGLGTEWANVGTKVTTTVDHIIADIQRMNAETAAYEAETLRQMEASWKKVKPPVTEVKEEVKQVSVQMQNLGRVNQTVWESVQAGQELLQAYRDAGLFVGMQGGALIGYQQQRAINASKSAPTDVTGGAQWGNTLNVNVNSTDAKDIAGKLVEEMRRNGVRF